VAFGNIPEPMPTQNGLQTRSQPWVSVCVDIVARARPKTNFSASFLYQSQIHPEFLCHTRASDNVDNQAASVFWRSDRAPEGTSPVSKRQAPPALRPEPIGDMSTRAG
jgi:hypothetical protein